MTRARLRPLRQITQTLSETPMKEGNNAMEIIRKGVASESKTYRVSCDNCDTLFKFQQLEANWVTDNRDGDYLEVDCPVCGKSVTVTP